MMKQRLFPGVLVCLALLSGTAAAKTSTTKTAAVKLKPGLWEIRSTTRVAGIPLPGLMPFLQVAPEPLINHIDYVMQQNRAALGPDDNLRVCISSKQIKSNDFFHDEGSGCDVSRGQRSGNTLRFAVNCSAPPASGNIHVQLVSNTQWMATSTINALIRGTEQAISNEATGTWLGSSCKANH